MSKEMIDEKTIKERFKMLQLKLPLKELNEFSDNIREQVYNDLYYLQTRLKDIAATKDAYLAYDISPHRRLYISIENNCVNLYIYDSQLNHITQYVTAKELLRISKADSFLIKQLKNFDKEKCITNYKEIKQKTHCIKVILNANVNRGSPIKENVTIDTDFDYFQK